MGNEQASGSMTTICTFAVSPRIVDSRRVIDCTSSGRLKPLLASTTKPEPTTGARVQNGTICFRAWRNQLPSLASLLVCFRRTSHTNNIWHYRCHRLVLACETANHPHGFTPEKYCRYRLTMLLYYATRLQAEATSCAVFVMLEAVSVKSVTMCVHVNASQMMQE